jgi:Cdc6-like AAA superfamily ATPase
MHIEPVTPEYFFDREGLFKKLEKRFQDFLQGYHRNFALIGPRYIGKTSLILKFLDFLSKGQSNLLEEVIPIYIEVNDIPLPNIAYKVVVSVLNRLLYGKLFAKSISGIEGILKELKGKKPAIAKMLLEIIDCQRKKNIAEMFDRILNLPKLIYDEIGSKTILILDEFCRFSNYGIKDWIKNLKEEVMVQSNTLFILISSEQEVAKEILNKELSLLFGNFEVIALKNFNSQQSIAFLENRLSGFSISKDIINTLVYLTKGFPLYLDLISREIRENFSKEDFIDEDKIIKVLDRLILDGQGFLNRFFYLEFDKLVSKQEKSDLIPFIFEIAHGINKISDLKKSLGVNQTTNIKFGLNGYIEKIGSFLRIKDPLFKIWINHFYEPKMLGISLENDRKRLELIGELNKFKSKFSTIYDKQSNLKQIFISLLKGFDNEYIEYDNRRKFLPKFYDIFLIHEVEHFVVFQGLRLKGSPWLFIILKTKVGEDLVYEIMNILQGNLSKFSQKVVIALNEMDDTARIIFKAHKFWIWEEQLLERFVEIFADNSYKHE